MSNPASLAVIDHHLQQVRHQLVLNDPRPGARFNLAGMLRGMAVESIPGYERRVLEAAAQNDGEPFDPQRVRVPWGLLARDLQVGTSSAGGYLVGSDVLTPQDILRGFSVAADAGVTMIPGLTGNTSIPTTTTAPTGYVFASEAGTATESTPVTGQVALTPKTIGAYVELSRNLLLASPIAEAYARRVLLGAVGQVLDAQILQGAGSGGEMTGLFNLANVQVSTATTFDLAAFNECVKLSSEAGARDADLSFISTPAVRELLGNRENGTGGGNGFLWSGGRVGNAMPGYASNDCPSASAIIGPWPQVVVGMWGAGPMIEVNPYAQFKSGIVGLRVLLSADMGVTYPAAFVKNETMA